MARPVVQVSGTPEYERITKAVFDGPIQVHLLSGKRSREGWAVPAWASASAGWETLLPGGHLTIHELPERFAAALAELD